MLRLKTEQITLHRKRKGWSMAKLAMVTGMSPNTISEVEANVRGNPREDTIKRIAEAFGVDPLEFYEVLVEPAEREAVEVG